MDHNIHGRYPNSHGPEQGKAQNLGTPNPLKTTGERPIPKTRKVSVRTKADRISRSSPQKWDYTNGPNQSQRSGRVATTTMCVRRQSLPGVYGVLSILHPKLFKTR